MKNMSIKNNNKYYDKMSEYYKKESTKDKNWKYLKDAELSKILDEKLTQDKAKQILKIRAKA